MRQEQNGATTLSPRCPLVLRALVLPPKALGLRYMPHDIETQFFHLWSGGGRASPSQGPGVRVQGLIEDGLPMTQMLLDTCSRLSQGPGPYLFLLLLTVIVTHHWLGPGPAAWPPPAPLQPILCLLLPAQLDLHFD